MNKETIGTEVPRCPTDIEYMKQWGEAHYALHDVAVGLKLFFAWSAIHMHGHRKGLRCAPEEMRRIAALELRGGRVHGVEAIHIEIACLLCAHAEALYDIGSTGMWGFVDAFELWRENA